MADSDALLVVEDWISEHFFATDSRKESYLSRVLERLKLWKEQPENTRSRFTRERARLVKALAGLYADEEPGDPAEVHAQLRRILGYEPGPWLVTVDGPVRRLTAPGLETALVIIEATAADSIDDLFIRDATTVATPYRAPDGQELTAAAKVVSTVFLAEEAQFALIMAGRWLVVAEASRWPEGRYLAIDIQTVADRGDLKQGGEVDRALVAVDADSLAPTADGDIWWVATLEASVNHTVGVSADLREGVRESIELIANEVVDRRRAQGMVPLPTDQAQPLALQSLRFLYRILFLLYAEASAELKILPVGDPDYVQGYSVDRLRELIQVELSEPRSISGTHIYESLRILFGLVDTGHVPGQGDIGRGLEFHGLRADLFKPEATALIDEVKLGNRVLQQVLSRLLLSKERSGKERGYISYVELGINQLGAVYEGLMSYSGSFAEQDLYEVAPDGDPSRGSWMVPVSRADHLAEADFVVDEDPVTGQRSRRRYGRGQFVYRLSGRERQRSASYYTPEVLTRFTVSEALAELLDRDGVSTPADDILALTVCEPALGSGAFAIEAVRQLADEYLARKQDELGERIDPDRYPHELQRVKAYLALHNVYGVDLNATAVEFAEITLWLDTMAEGLAAPWFGLRLRRGNSLVGAARSFYTEDQVETKAWLDSAPTPEPLTDIKARITQDRPELSGSGGRVHHWLLPAAGWASTVEAKDAVALAGTERVAGLKKWRQRIKAKPTKAQLKQLVGIAHRAEELWAAAYRRLMVAERESSRRIPLFGQPQPEGPSACAVTREQIEASLADPAGAYRRLRRVMDAWCALWYWPLTSDVAPPTVDEWLDAAAGLLGETVPESSRGKRAPGEGQAMLAPADAWQALAEQESFILAAGNAQPVERVVERHPWLRVCEEVAHREGFFHWQLDFATVFGRGGFDLQVGNPPWVRPRGDSDALLAEGDPWWQLAAKPSEAERRQRRGETLELPGIRQLVIDGASEVVALAAFVGDVTTYPVLKGMQPDLYRCFMSRTWDNASPRGAIGLLHPETHFTDEKAGLLREHTYRRLRRHWQFVNELQLFGEIDHHVSYGVHVYGAAGEPDFLNASALYHPDTIERSLRHDGSGEEPGFKHEGRWDQRPHAGRIQRVTPQTLATWRDVLETPDRPASRTRMLYTVNRSALAVLTKLGEATRVGSLRLDFSSGWHEKNDRQKGRFEQRWGRVGSWEDAILQGPHLHVGNPFFKWPNPTMKHNQDWAAVDLETLPPGALPVTAYKPAGDRAVYDASYGQWDGLPVRDHYRVAWRAMAANTGERTLISAVVPTGITHVHTVSSLGGRCLRDLVLAQGALSSLLADASIRSTPKSAITMDAINRLSLPELDDPLIPRLLLRALRLNCLTDAYADLWAEVWDPSFAGDEWLLPPAYPGAPAMGEVGPVWTAATPLRRDLDRRNALVEIDALMAVMLGISADELCTIYRTQFAVLHGYDQGTYIFDANGRIVPNSVLTVWRKKGDAMTEEERTTTHPGGAVYTYEPPFAPRDREADFRQAIAQLRS